MLCIALMNPAAQPSNVVMFTTTLPYCNAAFAAQSLLAALGSVQFIANVVFGRLVLKEPVSFLSIAAWGQHRLCV
jgi:hypothetical protein